MRFELARVKKYIDRLFFCFIFHVDKIIKEWNEKEQRIKNPHESKAKTENEFNGNEREQKKSEMKRTTLPNIEKCFMRRFRWIFNI